jgi:hypothetical protein
MRHLAASHKAKEYLDGELRCGKMPHLLEKKMEEKKIPAIFFPENTLQAGRGMRWSEKAA